MGKRKLLKNIAYGLINSFISRNNDVSGYWGIGKLYSLMINSDKFEIEINLVKQSISPFNNEFNDMINYFSQKLFNQMNKQNVKKSFLKEACIVLISSPSNTSSSTRKTALTQMKCKIIITDDLEKRYIVETYVLCRKHRPKLENRRG